MVIILTGFRAQINLSLLDSESVEKLRLSAELTQAPQKPEERFSVLRWEEHGWGDRPERPVLSTQP